MSSLRSTPAAAAIAAATAGLCLMLSACSNGSPSASPGSTAPKSGSSASTSSSPGSSGSAGSAAGSGSSTGSSPAAVSTAGLTGNFCSDIVKMGQRLDKIPPPVNKGNLPADQAYARAVLTQVEAAFNGLAAEAPPNVAAAIHNLTGVYQSEANNITNYGSLAQIKAQEHKLTTDPAYLSAIRVLVMYMATKCG